MLKSLLNLFKKKSEPEPLWFDRYDSSQRLTKDQRIFLSYYTEEGILAVLGYDWLLNTRYKTYVDETVKAVEHFINTGHKVHFYMHMQQTKPQAIEEVKRKAGVDYMSAVKALNSSDWCVDLAVQYIKDTAILRTGK